VAAAWLHTACLPLPAAVAAAVEAPVREVQRLAHAVMDRPANLANLAVSATVGGDAGGGAGPGSPVEGETPSVELLAQAEAEGPGQDRAGETKGDETMAAAPADARGGIGSTSAPPASVGPVGVLPAPASPLAPVAGDVAGTMAPVMGLPTLGALYSAAGVHLLAAYRRADEGDEGGSAAAAAGGAGVGAYSCTLALPKGNLDGPVKDKNHKVTPADFTVTVTFEPRRLPPVLHAAMAAGVPGARGAAAGAAAASSAGAEAGSV
jgi:hypothetical protein